METCKFCGYPLGDPEKAVRYENLCDGVMTLEEDPFSAEIWDDHTLVWMCYGQRDQRRMDI